MYFQKNYYMLSNSLQLKLFDTLIRPILTYGSEIWISDFTFKDKTLDTLRFEKIHNRFRKFLLGVHKSLQILLLDLS